LRQRNFILCYLGGDSYAFVHRTFLEYFCATEFVHQFEKKKSLSLEGLLALYDAHCRDDDWREVLRLICGQLDEQFAGRIIAHLTERVDMEAWDGESPLPELVLAVWCLSEVRNINRIETTTGGDLLLKGVRLKVRFS
ncbi:MAG: signal transduction protein, partial [Candidatus Electrothrix sp. ATG1]|nr:signal transduction protein [Candidatus Electrothrix sp. ATG1]